MATCGLERPQQQDMLMERTLQAIVKEIARLTEERGRLRANEDWVSCDCHPKRGHVVREVGVP